MLLKDKVVLVAGATRMGDSLARALASRGADVAFSYRTSKGEAEASAAIVRGLGRRALVQQCDVRDDEAIQAVADTTAMELGRLDVLVMMASRYDFVPFEELTTQVMESHLGVDMRGTFLFMKACVPHMRASGGGRMITFSDWGAASSRPRYPGYSAYYVAKAGVKALTEAFALELAPDNILVNSIAPGPILAPESFDDDARRRVEAATPLGRWGGAEEIAKTVIALVDSDFITGETIRVDGGRHLR